MEETNLIKSKQRINELGEVFTPLKTVNLMLDQPEIKAKIEELTATFLEPAAGEGAFLVELLRRKMEVALKQSENINDYNDKSLIALSTLYGIELMEDNMEVLVMRMYRQFAESYNKGMFMLGGQPDKKVLDSAIVIIQANMVQGNALTKLNASGEPLIFSEWKLLPKARKDARQKVQRLEYTFQDILDGNEESDGKINKEVAEDIDLLSFLDEDYDPEKDVEDKKVNYLPVKITEVYKKLTDE